MIKIYFDDILIDTNSYTDLSNEYELFSNDFYLGSTASNYFKFSIDKTKVNGIPQKITIKDDDKNIAVLHPDSIKESKYTFDYECTDILTLMEKPYDASSLIETSSTGHITLLELVQDICSKYSIELGTTDFLGCDKQISWYDNSRNARTYIGYVAELNGGYATVENDGKLYFKKQNKTSSLNISINNCDDFSIGEYHKITRVVFDNGVVKYEFGTNDGDVIYLDTENVFITEESDVKNIYNSVKNLEFYTFEVGSCPVSIDVRAGDIISFVDGNNIYKTIAGYSLYYYGIWQGNYKLDVQTSIKKETQTTSLDKKIKNISSRINYDEAELKIVAEKVSDNETSISQLEITTEEISSTVSETTKEQNEKISKITQTTDEINSKISDIADITTSSESLVGSVNLEKVNESEPIAIKIHPISEDISYLYPSNYLYPSDDLYLNNRVIRFTNKTTEKSFDWEIPADLLYYDQEHYDEFILNYDSQTCSIIKRVEYDKATNKNKLKATEETIPCDEYPTIALTAGNYTVSLPGYSSAYLYVQLMASNIYTTQFATKVEVKSSIKQTADAINLEVSKKVGKNEVISRINLTSEAATIQASKINIGGVISAINNNTSTTIDGNKIATGSITSSQIKAGAITADKVSSDVITTKNFNSQKINADNITAGTISTSRLDSDVITTKNFSAQDINAEKITTGVLNADRIPTITADKINVTNLSSVSSNLGNISGGNLNIGDGKFSVTNDGVLTATSGTIGGWTLSANTLKNSSGTGTTTLNSNGRLSFRNGSYFFGVGNGSEHPVASSLSAHSINYWTNLSVSGTTASSTWIGGSGIYGNYLSLLCNKGQSIAIGRASGTGDAMSINPNGSLRYSEKTGDWTMRTDDGGIYLRCVSGGLKVYGSYDNNKDYHAGRSGKFPYQHGYLYFVNGIFVGRGTS